MWPEARPAAREDDEEADTGHSADRVARLGADQTGSQERDRACVDNCAPIGRTEDGKLVYSMKCETCRRRRRHRRRRKPHRRLRRNRKSTAAAFSACPTKESGRTNRRVSAARCAGPAISGGDRSLPGAANSLGFGRRLECSLLLISSAEIIRCKSVSSTPHLLQPSRDFLNEPTHRPRRRLHLPGPLRGATGAEDLRGVSQAMPFESQAIHVRWSGEGVWMPLGDLDFGVSTRTTPAIPRPARSSSIPAGSARPRSCWPMAGCISPARWDSSPEIISSR